VQTQDAGEEGSTTKPDAFLGAIFAQEFDSAIRRRVKQGVSQRRAVVDVS